METLQSYLPSRVPSNVDFGLNVAGALARRRAGGGAGAARRDRPLEPVSRPLVRRRRARRAGAAGAVAVRAAVPGRRARSGWARCSSGWRAALADWLLDTPFLEWLPVRDSRTAAAGAGRGTAVRDAGRAHALPAGLFASSARSARRAASRWPLMLRWASAPRALSAALSWGPAHAWAWLSLPVQLGLLARRWCWPWLLLPAPRAACAALLLLALVVHLSLLNQAPDSAYFAADAGRPGSRAASSASTAWRSGWAGSGLTRRWSMCWCASRAGDAANLESAA